MPGLSSSRWAPSNIPKLTSWPRPPPPPRQLNGSPGSRDPPAAAAATSAAAAAVPAPEKELSRFLKIVARMNWKLPFLENGYEKAVCHDGKTEQDIAAHEIHFKLDFFEYYMHLERALVHLLGVYGITIDRSAGPQTGSAPGQHRYHQNVLEALSNPENPLYPILGVGEARHQLGRAKQLRNRWKDLDEYHKTGVGSSSTTNTAAAAAPMRLADYNLEDMLKGIFAACDQAYAATERHVREARASQHGDGSGRDQHMSSADWTTEEEDWTFMVDAMDWESV